MIGTYAIVAVVAYLLGSIPFGYILVRIFLKEDIRRTGSGNIGATNVGRTGHKGLAVATLVLDAGKGFAAVLLAGAIIWPGAVRYISTSAAERDLTMVMLAGLLAVLGHMFPIWLRFKGGKGVATALGAFGFFAPVAMLVSFAVFAIVVAATRFISLGSILAAVAFPFATFFVDSVTPSRGPVAVITLTSLLIIAKHRANIRRLLAGTEPKLGAKPALPPQEVEKQA